MNKKILILLFVLGVAGCTQQLQQYTVEGVYQSVTTDYNLDVLVTDEFRLRATTLFSGEMTRLTLNLINLASVDFENIHAVLINADDLDPVSENEYYELIEPNNSEMFDWDLTAPQLGIGESLILNNIQVRVYYDTHAETTKTILLKEPGDRSYQSTYSSSTESPIAIYFDTSYESVTTLEEGYKNFTVNMIFFNNYSGTIDYYDNSNMDDNYIQRLVLGFDSSLEFYNYYDIDSPWIKVNESMDLEALGLDINDLLLKDYYFLEYETLESIGYDICDPHTQETLEDLSGMLTEQRQVLWMTRGTTKVNVLRFGAPSVESDTEVELYARVDYSYSQDYGGEGFGVVVYGMG